MTFSENLKALRTARGISQKDLAEELGFSFQNISKWECGTSLPDIETLLSVANYFGTTTDALLGHITEEKTDTLKITKEELTLYREYPQPSTTISGRVIVFAIDGEGKIANIVYLKQLENHSRGYVRREYQPFDDQESTIIYEYAAHSNRERRWVPERRQIKIPTGGFVFTMGKMEYVTKKILNFITPEEYTDSLDEAHYLYNQRTGVHLFNAIRHDELDSITVKLTENGIVITKPAETVDPLAVNIDSLAKIVRRELEKKHNKHLQILDNRIEEVAVMAEEGESSFDELEDRIGALEEKIEELEEIIQELQDRLDEAEEEK